MSLVSLLDEHPDEAVALIEGDTPTTYAELRQLVAATRAGLVAAGCSPGDRIGIICTNTRASVLAILGSVSGGMVAVPLHPSSPLPELQRELSAVDAHLVLTGTEVDAELHPQVFTPPGSPVDGVEPLPSGPDTEPVPCSDDTVAVMLFTSGTAGSPKAAMLSHGNLTSNQKAIIAQPESGQGPDAVVLAVLPLSHVFGLNVSLLSTLRAGGTVVLEPRFDAARCVELIKQHRVTLFAGVPPMWRALLELPDDVANADAFGTIHRFTSGASALHRTLWSEFRERFGIELSEGYGLTETSPVVTTHSGHPIRPGSVGKALPGVEVRVVDYDDLPVPPDDSGDIKVRGPNVFMGYWNDEEATKAVLSADGWLSTGDVGVMSEDGYLYLVDRAKDIIIVSGFNVYPYEVEAVLVQHPLIRQAVVIGRDDERRGERVVAYVKAEDPERPPSLDEVVEFCRTELARYKAPSELHVVEELPIAPTGKRIRRELS